MQAHGIDARALLLSHTQLIVRQENVLQVRAGLAEAVAQLVEVHCAVPALVAHFHHVPSALHRVNYTTIQQPYLQLSAVQVMAGSDVRLGLCLASHEARSTT